MSITYLSNTYSCDEPLRVAVRITCPNTTIKFALEVPKNRESWYVGDSINIVQEVNNNGIIFKLNDRSLHIIMYGDIDFVLECKIVEEEAAAVMRAFKRLNDRAD